MALPFFTIVTISYNQGQFLEETIQSVLSQEFVDYEYIIQDPGSTDGSIEIIKSYQSSILFLGDADDGPADGLNRAFSHAKGQYYMFLNSDDYLLPGALSRMYNWIMADHQRNDVYSGACKIVNGQGKFLRNSFSDTMSLRRAAYRHSILIQPSTAFKSLVFRGVGGFNPANRSTWDCELFVDMAMLGCSFTKSDRFISAYRVHSASITGMKNVMERQKADADRLFEKITSKKIEQRSSLKDFLYKFERKLLNPRDTISRIFGGPIAGLY